MKIQANHLVLCISLIAILAGCQTSNSKQEATKDLSLEESTSLSIATSHLNNSRPDKAIEELKPLLQENPNHYQALNMTGLAHLALSNGSRAQELFQKAISIRPEIAISVNLSSAYLQNKRFRDAEKLLNQMLKDPKFQEYEHKERIYHNIGLALSNLKKPLSAKVYLDRAVHENPLFYLSHMELASLNFKLKRPADALASLEKARFACPTCFPPVQGQIKWYQSKGDSRMVKRILRDYKMTEGVTMKDRQSLAELESTMTSLLADPAALEG
jgi:pentatricopeptide repeat protein